MGQIIYPNNASILVTEDCNLACTYCFEHHNKKYMDYSTAKTALEFLAFNAIKDKQDNFHAMIFGGEPLLNIDIIEQIFQYGTSLADKLGIRFTANIVTNATVMNEKIYKILSEWKDKVNLNIQLSVDGTEEVHNKYRLTKTGIGSFELVKKHIPIFQKLYRNDPTDRRLSIHGCLNKETISKLWDSYNFFKYELGFKQIWFLPVAEEKWDANDIKIYDQQCELIYKDILKELEKNNNIEESYYYSPFDRYAQLHQGFHLPCGAGKNYVTITADGEIYPCHQIYFNDPEKTTLIGDIFNGIDNDKRRIFLEYENKDLNCNKDCKNYQCFRCLAANWVHNGSIFSQIKGYYCGLSSVENKYQKMLKEKIDNILARKEQNKTHTDADCLCNCREGNTINGCDVVNRQENCQSGNNPNNPGCLCDSRAIQEMTKAETEHKTDIDILAEAIELLILKVDNLEKLIGDICVDKKS